ncbi:MAG: hypothetical protein MZV63_09790 [Marinilabiliales bacterium]|nr:hypothetical protein [Marinilabiliales bacterium]
MEGLVTSAYSTQKAKAFAVMKLGSPPTRSPCGARCWPGSRWPTWPPTAIRASAATPCRWRSGGRPTPRGPCRPRRPCAWCGRRTTSPWGPSSSATWTRAPVSPRPRRRSHAT